MKISKKKLYLTAVSIFTCAALSGCSLSKASPKEDTSLNVPAEENQAQEPTESTGQEEGADSAAASESADNAVQGFDGYPRGNRIDEQSFTVNLRPLGEVTFASYEPDTSENPLSDVVFLIEKEGDVLMQLSGTTEDNVGLEMFHQVEAVSFLDYNHDNYDDIIIILSYYFGAGPQAATPHSLIRYYKGTAEGGFIYEAQMSEDASSALAEITVETARKFISGEKTDEPDQIDEDTISKLAPWQQAYLEYLTTESVPDAQSGYTLISLSDDGIPQLAEIGADEATGCRIVHYANGEVHVTQLNRLFFSYIPQGNLLCNSEGNMDYYYDLVFRLEDGELNLIASGYYGAEDNSNVQYDEKGDPIYLYEWEGVRMSREEYQTQLSKVYDFSKAVSYHDSEVYSLDEIKRRVAEY